jgi:lactate permease
MNQSGETTTIGLWAAGAGGILFAFISPIIGWLGVAVTGSDTSSNSLFGPLQVAAAQHAGLPEILTAAANSSGGVMGKMVSPQNLAIGLAAVNMAAQGEQSFTEGDLFRRVIGWSLVMLLFMAVIVMLQATDVLGWMVP